MFSSLGYTVHTNLEGGNIIIIIIVVIIVIIITIVFLLNSGSVLGCITQLFNVFRKGEEKTKYYIRYILRFISYFEKEVLCQPVKSRKTDEKTSDFLIRFRSQRPSSRAVGFKSPVD